MGITASAMNLLLDEANRQAFSGSVLTLGRLHTYFAPREVRCNAARRDVSLAETAADLHINPQLAKLGYISDESFFRLLGFNEVRRLDYSDYEQADEILDLNVDETPAELVDRFDVIVDFGTIEHVFHLPNCLGHLERMVKPGGRIIHFTPSSNCVDHGFYSVSPTLFVDYYRQRGHRLEKVYLCELARKRFERKRCRAFDYLASGKTWLSQGRLNGSVFCTFAVVNATENPDFVTPQQSAYLQTWDDDSQGVSRTDPHIEPPNSKAGRLLNATKSIPLIHWLAKATIRTWRAFRNWLADRKDGRVPYPFVGKF